MATDSTAQAEIRQGKRFAFGRNWSKFLRHVTPARIEAARDSLCSMLAVSDLAGLRFLDIGSGSGVFSLAAHQMGAEVRSVDYDELCVACAMQLRHDFVVPSSPSWTIVQGSVLDEAFMDSLGEYDVVYSWGVLHHTGAMWRAMDHAAARCRVGGQMFISIYNDQGFKSRCWRALKCSYNRSPAAFRSLQVAPVAAVYLPPVVALNKLRSRSRQAVSKGRGMSAWRDLVDWVGGYPFEVAKPEAVLQFLRQRGFTLENLMTTQRHGCNQFVFRRQTLSKSPVALRVNNSHPSALAPC